MNGEHMTERKLCECGALMVLIDGHRQCAQARANTLAVSAANYVAELCGTCGISLADPDHKHFGHKP